jgi:predicted GNAT family acetyltransferase
MSPHTFTIDHQVEQSRFVIPVADDTAVLEYQVLDNNRLDFTRTYVPPRHRGQGHAEALVHAGLTWAKSKGYALQASCWYVDKFLTKDSK